MRVFGAADVDRDRAAGHVHALAIDAALGVGFAAEKFEALLKGGIVDVSAWG